MLRRCAFVLFVLVAVGRVQAGEKKMNLLVIVTDDHAPWSIGAYGNRESKTPTLDRLAREGAPFTRAFTATPVCSPSRATFLTGRYGTQLKITDWISPKEAKSGLGLPVDAVTWMQVLRRAGYITGLVGKWHLGDQMGHHPTERGFSHFMGFLGGGEKPMNPTLEMDGKTAERKGAMPNLLGDGAIAFLNKNKQGPFALMLNFREPHLPYGPVPREDSEPFKDLDPTIPEYPGLDVKQVKKWTVDYYASIHAIDRNVARVLAALEQLGLLENTIVVFTSDHGYMIGHHGLHSKGNAHLVAGPNRGRQRANMYDLSLRVPLIIRWPGVVKGGTKVDEMVCNVDTFATMLGMLKTAAPSDYRQEGKDFSPLLRGEKGAWRDIHFSQYNVHNGRGKGVSPSVMRSAAHGTVAPGAAVQQESSRRVVRPSERSR